MNIILQTDESNVFDGRVIEGKSLNERGVPFTSPLHAITQFISVNPHKAIVFTRAYNYAVYGSEGFIEYHQAGEGLNIAILPSGAERIRVTILMSDVINFRLSMVQRTNAIFSDDLSLEYQHESAQKFYRAKLSGKITFLRNDYEYIMSKPFNQKFTAAFVEEGKIIMKGTFHRTDCTINDDDESVVVQPQLIDEYTELMEGVDREYDLIKLAPETSNLMISKRPLIQYYSLGDSMVTCIGADTFWRQDCAVINSRQELEKYHFALNTPFREIYISGKAIPNVNGRYSGVYKKVVGTKYWREDNEYYIELVRLTTSAGLPYNGLRICDKTGKDLFTSTDDSSDPSGVHIFNPTFQAPAFEHPRLEGVTNDIYSRILCDVDSIDGQATYLFAPDDMVSDNRNYRRCIGLSFSYAVSSTEFSKEPTQWGHYNEELYFAPPYSLGDTFYPLAQGTWVYYSLWIPKSSIDWVGEAKATKFYAIKDAMPIWSVISVLLHEIAPNLKHEGTREYSEFLYGPFNPISRDDWRMYITPKSNIRNGEYQTPAQKAPVTLQQILTMLANAFKCYCFVDGDKFRIEHIQYFRNGGQYFGIPAIGADLTKEINTRNGKTWGFAKNSYSFDKFNMPERYEFSWMDDSTDFFNGSPIIVKSDFVEREKKEDISMGMFTSDVDYIIMNPEDISQDGFVLFSARKGDAIKDDRSYFGYVETKGTNALTQPYVNLIQTFNGRLATLRVQVTGGVATIVFLDSSGQGITSQAQIQPSGTIQEVKVTIPRNAASISFSANGSVTAKVYSLLVENFPQVPINRYLINGVESRHQNGYMSLYDIHSKYWLYDMPSYLLEVNGTETQAKTIQRMKKQSINFPYRADINPMELIKTGIGLGQIEKLSVNLSSKFAKTTLKYDTY